MSRVQNTEEGVELLEKQAQERILQAYQQYHKVAYWEINRWEKNYKELSKEHKEFLPRFSKKCELAKLAVEKNQAFFDSIIEASNEDYELDVGCGVASPTNMGEDFQGDPEKVQYVLKNFARDWSAEGQAEREACYGPILAELKEIFGENAPDSPLGSPSSSPPPPRAQVLVPGCGLGRLCVEIARMGLHAQGNEFSYYMIFGSAFVLNHMERRNQFHIYPWIHGNCNHRSDADQLRGVPVPDLLPADAVPGPGLLSMCLGDFAELYRAPKMQGQFDCVVTCFFLDTAHNVLEYLEVIRGVLVPGGRWINFGPLLYHWADSHAYLPSMELSVELSLQDVKEAAKKMGFRFIKEATHDAPYMANQRSMFKTVYQAEFWTAVKEG